MSPSADSFSVYPIPYATPAPPQPDNLSEKIPAIIAHHLPGREILAVRDRGEWVRRIIEVTLDGGQVVYVKFQINAAWFDTTVHTRVVAGMLRERGLGGPEVLVADSSKTLVPVSFNIESKVVGTRLDRLLERVSPAGRPAVFAAIGRHYRGMHAIRGPRAGVWFDDPNTTLSLTPNDFYLQNDIGGADGAGENLVKRGHLARATLARLVDLWRARLDWLKDHPPVLVHANPMPWTIYLDDSDGGWRVSYLGDSGECLWWDAAYDLALLRWPPLADRAEEEWQAVAAAYGPLPDEDRMKMYHLMQCLLTGSWAYMGPQSPAADAWLAVFRANLDRHLNEVMDSIA